ncbi:MAG TPA: prolipoprotein diacylglyceryl transferase [Thermodesulfobacteriota bacterium]|nr:prolipoprotein diacylglyceryl transferase [Thermodesulfobacteriota bacterium]
MYPALFRIGDIAISSYIVMLIIGFVVAYLLCIGEFKRKGLSESLLDLLFAACVMGGIIGSKILSLIEEVSLGDLIADPIRYLSSGFTGLGGFVGVVILVWVIVRLKKVNFWLVTDAMAPTVMIYAIARIGCFLVGDDYGIPSNLPWAMSFPEGSPPTDEKVHPTQIYEALITFGIFVYIWKIRKKDMPIGWLTAIVFLLAGAERFLVEFIRNTQPSFIPGISVAQLMSLGLIVAGVLKLLQLRAHERKKPKLKVKK